MSPFVRTYQLPQHGTHGVQQSLGVEEARELFAMPSATCSSEEEEQYELREMAPVTIEMSAEPMVSREEMSLLRAPPPIPVSEPMIKQKIVHRVALPNRPSTSCTFGKMLNETHECIGLVSSTKNLGNIDTRIPITPGTMKNGSFIVRKVVYGLCRYY